MGISQLRARLEKGVGTESFRFVIPNAFLPPRFQKESEGRNLVLVIDREITMRSQWQGEHLERHKPLSKAEVRRLLRDVNRSMVAYRRNLGIYGRFFETWGEEPLEDFRYHQPYSAYKPPIAKSDEPEEPEPAEGPLDPEEIKASILFGTSAAEDDLGGESPLPDWEWEDA